MLVRLTQANVTDTLPTLSVLNYSRLVLTGDFLPAMRLHSWITFAGYSMAHAVQRVAERKQERGGGSSALSACTDL